MSLPIKSLAKWPQGRFGVVLLVWLVTLLLIRLVVDGQKMLGLHEFVLILVPVLFMYVPVWLLNRQGIDSWSYPLAIPAFSDRAGWWRGLKLALIVGLIVSIPFAGLYHIYQSTLFGFEYEGLIPSSPLELIGYHLFFVAIPEEIFYRGYMQTRLDQIWTPRWKVFGVMVGPGLLVTSLLFAFGHTLVAFQWWHFSIFFPSLLFGWMRARSGGIIAGAFYHAWANIFVTWLDTLYGIVPP